jgi:hypothetical protein
METKLPYVVQPGSIKKILEKIKEAKTPDRFTTDFLDTKLGFRGGNYRQFIPLAKNSRCSKAMERRPNFIRDFEIRPRARQQSPRRLKPAIARSSTAMSMRVT